MNFFKRKIVDPLLALLKQGVTPHKLSLSVAVGLLFGTTPLVGTSTTLCLLVGLALRLNQPAIQIVNYAAYPLQLALILPFIHWGGALFGQPAFPYTAQQLMEAFSADWLGTFGQLWGVLLRATLAWLLCMLPASALAYFLTRPLFAKAVRSFQAQAPQEGGRP